MKILSRVALAAPAWDRNSAQRNVAAPVRLREESMPSRAPGLVRGHLAPLARLEAAATDIASRYDISCITPQFDTPAWTGIWRRLLATSASPEKIYQTPEFFRFLTDTRAAGSDRFELFAIRDRVDAKVVGIVPVRLSNMTLDAKLGNVALMRCQRRIVRILGSVPLTPADPALQQQLFAYLLAAFPDCAAVSMQAFPVELLPLLGSAHQRPHVVHGWRACHTIPLPATPALYLSRLSSKKRYNLARQYRLLEQATGPLELIRIDRSADVKDLVAAIGALSADGSGGSISARDYRVLAANRLLLSYVLKSGDDVVAVIAGSRYGDTWHVHQIHYAKQYRHLSAGAVAMHTALQNVIADFAFTWADFGFGEPRHNFASTHLLKQRGHVLIVRNAAATRLLFGMFIRYGDWHAAVVRVLRPHALRLLGLLRR